MKPCQATPAGKRCIGPDGTASLLLVCGQCGVSKLPEEFRRRFTGREARLRQCRACHAESERLRRRAKQSRARRQEVNRDLARLKQAKSARQVALVCESMIRGFGGPEGFAKAWTACLRRDLSRGGFAALRHLEATIRLIQHCEANRPDYRSMSDEELLALASRSI
jgi:hypothetical protein